MARNEIEVGVRVSGVPKGVSDVKSLTDSIQKLGDVTKNLETKSASGQKTLGYFKSLQTEITETKKQLTELKKSGALDPSFNFDRAIKDLNNYNRKLDQAISKRTLAITGKKAEGLTPVFAEVTKNLTEVNNKIKESAQLQKDATYAFTQMGKIRRQTTEAESKGYNKYLEDTFKGYNKQRDEFVKNVKTQYSQGTREAEKYAKNVENLLNPAKQKTSLLQSFSILGGAKFKTSDVDTQLKTLDTAMSQVGLRISTLRSGMAEAFAKGRVADVSKEMSVLKAHVNEVQGALRTQPLLKTEDSIGRLGLLQQKLKEVTKDYNTFSNPPAAKQAKKTLGIDEVSSSLRTLQMKLSETAHTFDLFKTKKTPLLDLQASILVSRTELANFIKQARAGGLTDAFAKDIAGARNELKKLDMDLKKTLAPTSQKIRIGRGTIDLSGLDTASQKLREVNQHLFDLGTGLQYIGRTGLMYVSAPLIALGTFALRSFANLEQANSAFKALTGSAIEGTQVFKELVSFSLRSPVDLKQLMAGTQQLLALGFTAKEVVPMMKVLSEAVAATGASADTLQRVTLALSQVKGRAKLVGDEIRQLGQVGLPVIQILAKKMGKTEAEFYETMKKSVINGTDAINAIIVGLHEKYAGYLEIKAKTLSGSWQILSNNISVTLAKLGERLNTAFAIPETLLSLSKYIEGLGNAIVAFPSLTKMIADFTGLVTVLFSVIAALGIIAKIFSYWKGYQGLLIAIGISGGTLAIILGIATAVYLTYVYFKNIKITVLEIELAIMDWGAPFDRIIAKLEKAYKLFKWIADKANFISGPAALKEQKFMQNSIFDPNTPPITAIGPTTGSTLKPYEKSAEYYASLPADVARVRRRLEKELKELEKAMAEESGGGLFSNLKAHTGEINSILDEMAKGIIRVTDNTKGLGRTFKDVWKETIKSLKDIDILGNIFGKDSDYNVAKEKIQKLKQSIQELITGGSKEKDSKIQGFVKQIADLEIPSSLKDSLLKFKEAQQETAAEFRFSGDAVEKYKNEIKTLEAGIKGLYLVQEHFGTSSELLDQLNSWKSSLESNSNALTFLYDDKITKLKQSLISAGQNVATLVSEFEAQNSELLSTGDNLKIASTMYEFFVSKVKDIKAPVDEVVESWKKYNEEIYAGHLLMGVTIDYFEKTERRIAAAKILLESLTLKGAPAASIDEAKIELVKAYKEQIGNVRLQLNSLGVDSEKVTEILKELGDSPNLFTLIEVLKKLQDLSQDLGKETKKSWDKDKAITELKTHAITKLGDAIKNIWNQTEMSFKDVWHGALDTFVDTMVMMVIQAKFAGIAISLAMAAATAGISLVLGMLAMAFGGKKTVKVEPLTDRLKKVFDDFITDFKGAMGDFKERLFPASGEAKKSLRETELLTRGIELWNKMLKVGLPSPEKSELRNIVKELDLGEFQEKFINFEKGMQDRIVQFTTKLSENIVGITDLMVTRFGQIKSVVEEIFDLYKQQKDFVKDMVQTVTDVTRTGMSTGQLYTAQQGDLYGEKGLVSQVKINETNLATVKAQLVAAYEWKDLTEEQIALRKIDIDYLKKDQKDLFDLQIEKIGETKEAYLTFWDTVQTLVSETLDLIGQKVDFIKDIQATIDGIKNSSKSAVDLFKDSIALKDALLGTLVGKEGQEKIGILGELKTSWQGIWDNAKSFFADLTAKVTELTTGKTAFTEGITDTIKTMERSVLEPVALLKKQQEDVTLLQGQFNIATDTDKIKLGESLKTALTSVWETGKGIFGDITSLESELVSINDSISKETNIAELTKLGQDKLAVQAKIDALKLGSGLTSIDKLLGETVGQLNTLNIDTGSAYDGLIRVTNEVAEGLGDLTGWETKIVDGLTFLSTEGGKAYDALIGSNLQLLGIDTKATDLAGELNGVLDKTQFETIAGLQNLQLSGEGGFKDLIDVNILMLGIESLSLDYLKDIEKGIYGTLTILGEIGKNAAAATGGNVNTITSTLSDLFDVPKMAAGGIVNKPTLAMIGEAGPEAVIPLSKMGQSSSVNIKIDGAMIMDEITMSKFARTIGSKIKTQQMRYV